MEEPCTCEICGEITELRDMNFYVKTFCHCVYESCTHGLCDRCKYIEDGKHDNE